MRNTTLAVAITFILSFGPSKPVTAYHIKDIVYGYGSSVATASLIAVFGLIPVCTSLRPVKEHHCSQNPHGSECELSSKLMFRADLSWQGFVGGAAAAVMALTFGGVCGSGPNGSPACIEVGSHAAMTLLGIGIIISHASALALDVSLWKDWNPVKNLSAYSIQPTASSIYNSILGGATFNGIVHLLPYGGLFSLAFIEITSRIRAKMTGSDTQA